MKVLICDLVAPVTIQALVDAGIEVDNQPDITAEDERNLREIVRNTSLLIVETRLHASALLVRLDRKQEAVEELDRVLAIEPGRAEAYSRRATLLKDLGRYAEAIPNIDEFLRLSELEFEHPDIRRAYQLRAECLAAMDTR